LEPPEVVTVLTWKPKGTTPVLRTVNDCGGGADAPATALNVNPVCESAIPVESAETETFTGIVTELEALATVTAPWYVPGAKPERSKSIVIGAPPNEVVAPVVGET